MLIKFLVFSMCYLNMKMMADWGYPEIDDVVILNTSNHNQFVQDYDEALVYYHLPKCKYCVQMDKFFGALALIYKEKDQRIPFASFDCSKDMQFCQNLQIPAYPFVVFYIRSHPVIYYGKRNKIEIENFIEKIMNKKPKKIELKNLQNLQTNQLIVLYFGSENRQGFHLFDLVCKYHQELNFFWIENNFNIAEIKKLKLFKDSTFHKTDFQDDVFILNKENIYHLNKLENFDNVDGFINKMKHPDLIELDDNFNKMIQKDFMEFFVLFVENKDDPLIDEFEKFAHDHKKKIKFLLAIKNLKANNNIFQTLSDALLIDQLNLPQVRIFKTNFSLHSIEKYKKDGSLEYNFYQDFLRNFKANKIRPYYKYQKIKQKNYGSLEALNSYDYQQKIFRSGQDSIVLYHSNFKEHQDSKKMLKILQKISQNQKFKNLKFFCIDADENEIKSFYHDQRPVLLLYSKKDQQTPLIYDKEIDFKKVKQFIKSKKNIKKNKDVENHFNTEL